MITLCIMYNMPNARVCSVLEQWGENPSTLATADTALLTSTVELSLLQKTD